MTTIMMRKQHEMMTFTGKDGSSITLRPVEEKDASQIITRVEEIIAAGEYLQKEETRSLEEELVFIKKMKDNDNMYVAVDIEGQVSGIARVIRGGLDMNNHVGLFRTWIIESAQGKGVGKKIMEYTLKWGNAKDLHKIWLTVFSENKIAIELYKKYGFVIEGAQRDQLLIDGDYQDEIYMAYFLNG